MQFSCVPTLISLLAALPLAILSASSSDPQLQRRHHDTHEPFTNVYIMRDNIDYSKGFLPIYNFDGNVAFQLTNDACFFKTTYRQQSGPQPEDLQVQVDPNGPLKDTWRMSYIVGGVRHHFEYVRNFSNKDGKIYTVVGGHKRDLIAELTTEKREETWLTHGGKAVKTFTLSSTATAPHMELVALMGLVALRVYNCGI
ncbi:hypothetical protein VP01_2894g2 [Puccinia sorghi]|uniref:Uncharacterized protein n=1 Tax=Puccinia sorghi TaxID=27349 RepID=A0A0L6V3F2_9BASI|nr:hypothetical protein VP01_2894g2 [Puccinia sorghi]